MTGGDDRPGLGQPISSFYILNVDLLNVDRITWPVDAVDDVGVLICCGAS